MQLLTAKKCYKYMTELLVIVVISHQTSHCVLLQRIHSNMQYLNTVMTDFIFH